MHICFFPTLEYKFPKGTTRLFPSNVFSDDQSLTTRVLPDQLSMTENTRPCTSSLNRCVYNNLFQYGFSSLYISFYTGQARTHIQGCHIRGSCFSHLACKRRLLQSTQLKQSNVVIKLRRDSNVLLFPRKNVPKFCHTWNTRWKRRSVKYQWHLMQLIDHPKNRVGDMSHKR